MGPTLNSPLREVVHLRSENITVVLYRQSFGRQIKRSVEGNGRSVEVVG